MFVKQKMLVTSNLRVYKVCYFRKYLYCLLNWHTSIGAIKTDCMKIPAFNSRFCELHRPRAILASTGGTAADKDQPGPSYQLPPDSEGSPVIKFIAGKMHDKIWSLLSGKVYSSNLRTYASCI